MLSPLLLACVLAAPPPAPKALRTQELFPLDGRRAIAGTVEEIGPDLDRILDALAPLGAGDPIDGEPVLGVDHAAALARRDDAGLLTPTDPLLVQAGEWGLAPAWGIDPAVLISEAGGVPSLPWDSRRLIVRSWIRQARDGGGEEALHRALRFARLALNATVLPQDELEGLALLDEVLVAVESSSRTRRDWRQAATSIAAAEAVALRRVQLDDGAWFAAALAARVRPGWFGPKLADITRNRARGLLHHRDQLRERGASPAALAGHLQVDWLLARAGRGGVAELGRTALEAEARGEAPARAALAAWWLEQPWRADGPGLSHELIDVAQAEELTRWAFGDWWSKPMAPLASLACAKTSGTGEGDAGAWFRSFTGEHRSRWSELGLSDLAEWWPWRARIEPLPQDSPLLVEAAREVERGRSRLSRRLVTEKESTRLILLVRVLAESWLARAESAHSAGRLDEAEADLLRVRRLLRLVDQDSSTGWRGSRSALGEAARVFRLEARLALARGQDEGFLEAFRAWRTVRVAAMHRQALFAHCSVRWDLRHGSMSEALFKKQRVSTVQLDWIAAIAAGDFDHDLRRQAAHALWLLSHEGTEPQRKRCLPLLETLASDPDPRLAAQCTAWLDQEPDDDDVRGFEWDTFGMTLLDRSPIPESWWR